AGKLPKELKPLQEKAKALSAHIDCTIQMVRRISTELRPGILDHLGLAAALEWQANEFQLRTGIKCDVRADFSEPLLDQDLNTAFFRIFQETLTNIIRHAGATQVTVSLNASDGHIALEIKDNGRGISKEEISNTKSMGLLGMRERAALLGGEFEIGRLRRGKGTRVKVSIPLRRPRHQEFNHEDSFSRRSLRSASLVAANSR